MTEEQLIERLTALDRLAAIHVMGWKLFSVSVKPVLSADLNYWSMGNGSMMAEYVWQPTRDLNQCSEMDAVMRRQGWRIQIYIKPEDYDGPESIHIHMWRMGEKAGEMEEFFIHGNYTEPFSRTLCHLKAVLGPDFERTLKDAGVEV